MPWQLECNPYDSAFIIEETCTFQWTARFKAVVRPGLSAGWDALRPGWATTWRPNQSNLQHTSLFSLPTSPAAAVKNPPPHPKHGHWANPPEITTRELTTGEIVSRPLTHLLFQRIETAEAFSMQRTPPNYRATQWGNQKYTILVYSVKIAFKIL